MFDKKVVERFDRQPPVGYEEHPLARRIFKNDDSNDHGGKQIELIFNS